jgi:hypothetical protein
MIFMHTTEKIQWAQVKNDSQAIRLSQQINMFGIWMLKNYALGIKSEDSNGCQNHSFHKHKTVNYPIIETSSFKQNQHNGFHHDNLLYRRYN